MIPLYDENRPLRKPYVNYALIIANTVVFFYFFLQGDRVFRWALVNYGMIPVYVLTGRKLHTLLTSMFMHGDMLHLVGNMLYLFIFGDNVEDAFGHLGYLAFYILCGIAASFIHIISLFLMPPELFQLAIRVPAVGASGAISGVLGAYFLLYPRARIRTLVTYYVITVVSIPAYYYIGFWFIYQLLMGVFALALPLGVAFWAHIGGFVAGLVITKVLGIRPPVKKRRVIYYYIKVEPYGYDYWY